MEIDHEHIIAGIENLLRTIAMVIIDIKDGNPFRPLVEQGLRAQAALLIKQ